MELPARNPKAVVIWGRFQPPHIGHGTVFASAKAKYPNHDICIVPSLSCDMDTTFDYVMKQFSKLKVRSPTNKRKSASAAAPPPPSQERPTRRTKVAGGSPAPAACSSYPLTVEERIAILTHMFPDPAYHFLNLKSNNIMDILTKFNNTYVNTTLYLGHDRVIKIPPILKNVSFDQYSEQFEIMVLSKKVSVSATKIRNALLKPNSKTGAALLRAALQHGTFKDNEAAYQHLLTFLRNRLTYLGTFPAESKRTKHG